MPSAAPLERSPEPSHDLPLFFTSFLPATISGTTQTCETNVEEVLSGARPVLLVVFRFSLDPRLPAARVCPFGLAMRQGRVQGGWMGINSTEDRQARRKRLLELSHSGVGDFGSQPSELSGAALESDRDCHQEGRQRSRDHQSPHGEPHAGQTNWLSLSPRSTCNSRLWSGDADRRCQHQR